MNTENTDKRQIEVWPSLIGNTSREGMLRMVMRHVAYSLTDIVGRPFKLDSLRIKTVPLSHLTMSAADPEAETVGVYLRSGDDLPGRAILILPLIDAMYLADWLLEVRPGTTTKLGELECSALAETGNMLFSSFLNAVAEFIGRPLRLSPPAVMVDMLATVLEAAATPVAAISDELLIIEADFLNVESSLWMRFWVLPDPVVLTAERRIEVRSRQ